MTGLPQLGAWGLLGATALGALLSVGSALRAPSGDAGGVADAAAIVGEDVISRAEYDRAVAALATAKRNPLASRDRAKVLNRLIEEELLVQRALEIGLAKSDRSVRAAMVNAMILQATAPVAARKPTEDDLRAWYGENKGFFRAQPSLRIAAIAVGAPSPKKIAAVEKAIAENVGIDEISARFSDGPKPAVPDVSLPLSKLKDYLGGEAADALARAPAGGWVGPYRLDDFAVFYAVRERVDAEPPPFEATRDRIEAAWRRVETDKAFRQYLEWLESRVAVVRNGVGAGEP